MSAFVRGGNEASYNSHLVNQSIIDDYGSAQEITNQITNKIYKTSVKPHLVKGAAAAGTGAATADYSINGEGGGAAINSSFNSSSMDHSTNNSNKLVNNPSQ